jgi:hypothetical protein
MLLDRRTLLAAGISALAAPARAARPNLREFVGINTHTTYSDGAYVDVDAMIAKLKWLGVHHVRDSAPNTAWQGQANYKVMADAGLKFSLICWFDPVEQLAEIRRRAPNRDAIAQLEGPNELNNNPSFQYAGRSGPDGGAPYMADLMRAVAADPFFRGVPVAGVVSFPNIPTPSDLSNVHSYPKNGERPVTRLRTDIEAQQAVEPGKPVVITEAGFDSGEIGEDAQANQIVPLIEDALGLGVTRLYLYELLDDRPDNHWGLFRLDGTPKPAAYALRRHLQT